MPKEHNWSPKNHRRSLDSRREKVTHKYVRTEGSVVSDKDVHFQKEHTISPYTNGQQGALKISYKDGGTQNQTISKKIWIYFLKEGISITAEYLPGKLNILAHKESRNIQDSSEWKLDPRVFHRIIYQIGTPEIDLFASRVCHQIPRYRSWKMDPLSQGRDPFQISWSRKSTYALPRFP